jgi:hypothetical protein
MQNTSKELKKLAALATSDEVMCFRINDTVASLETAVERSYTIFAGISPPLFSIGITMNPLKIVQIGSGKRFLIVA